MKNCKCGLLIEPDTTCSQCGVDSDLSMVPFNYEYGYMTGPAILIIILLICALIVANIMDRFENAAGDDENK